jgi:hypothetical protein
MTQDEIIEMANKAGFFLNIDCQILGFEKFAQLVAQHEREEIIAMAESHAFSRMRGEFTPTSTDLICAIRASGQA